MSVFVGIVLGYNTLSQCQRRRLHSVLNMQLLEDASQVVLDGILGDAESVGYLAVGRAGSEKL